MTIDPGIVTAAAVLVFAISFIAESEFENRKRRVDSLSADVFMGLSLFVWGLATLSAGWAALLAGAALMLIGAFMTVDSFKKLIPEIKTLNFNRRYKLAKEWIDTENSQQVNYLFTQALLWIAQHQKSVSQHPEMSFAITDLPENRKREIVILWKVVSGQWIPKPKVKAA